MKTRMISAVAILSAAIFCWMAPSAFAGKGHGGGGFSSGNRGGGGGYSGSAGRGFSSYSGGRGYSGGYHAYPGGVRGYTGGGFSRIRGNYSSGYSAVRSNQYRTYSRSSNVYRGIPSKQYSSFRSSGQQRMNRSHPGFNNANRFANIKGNRGALGTGSIRAGETSIANQKNLAMRNGVTRQGNWARNNPRNANRFDQRTQDKLRNWQGNKSSWAEANQRHHGDHDGQHHDHDGHHHHDHDWWNHHCSSVIWVDWGWWGWWDGWWYPAWGYDPYYSYYAYDGPIYGYGGLAPDEIVANVQSELQRLGYYYDAIDGVLGPRTQEALMRYQRDRGLPVTGAVDQETVSRLGLA